MVNFDPFASESADPYGTSGRYGTAQDRYDLLTANGWRPATGKDGPLALWVDANGRQATEKSILDSLIRAPGAGDTSGQVGVNPATGRYEFFTYGPDGEPVFRGIEAPPVNPHPGTSYSVSQSFQDPAVLKENIRQFDVKQAADAQERQFKADELRVRVSEGDKNRAMQAQQRLDEIDARMQNASMQRAQMQQQLVLAEAQMQQQNADRAQRANEAGMADRLSRDRAIAEYSASPTDVGRASALMARDGGSPLSTAIGQGDTAITDRSLEPLMALLGPEPTPAPAAPPAGLLNRAMANPQRPTALGAYAGGGTLYDNGIVANPYGVEGQGESIDLYGDGRPHFDQYGRMIIAGTGGAAVVGDGPNAGSPAATNTGRALANRTLNAAFANQPPGAFRPPRFEDGGAVVGGEDDGGGFLNVLMKLAQALGMTPKAVAGEKGKANGETVYSNGDVMVMPDRGKGMPEMASGGIATGPGFMWPGTPWSGQPATGDAGGMVAPAAGAVAPTGGGVLNPALARAREFLSRIQQQTLQRSGFDHVPTPIELSDPGTDPYRQQLGAAVAAQLRGIPVGSFLNEAMRLRPRGMVQGYGGRTR